MWQAIRAKLPFRLGWKQTKVFDPDPQNFAYTSFGQVGFTVSPNAGGTFFSSMDLTAPGVYQDTHTVLVGQAPIFEGVRNQPLGYPGEIA